MPVNVALVARQTVPLYLIGLGTVQASLTVDIRSKVDGELRQVLLTEGQHVKKGDNLAKIDPHLFQATLNQAKAKKAQDEAALIAADAAAIEPADRVFGGEDRNIELLL